MGRVLAGVVIGAIVLVAVVSYHLATRTRSVAPPSRIKLIRHPNPSKKAPTLGKTVPLRGAYNIAPYATVTVSSVAEESAHEAAAVADGELDRREWVAESESSGAWIKLSWDRPVVINEILLFDRPDPTENILGGMLVFEDGSQIPVPELPPGGSPWRVSFAPKTVSWVVFRVGRSQGRSAGLVEFAVYGSLGQ